MPDRYLGQLLGKYRTSRLLGSGSFSWVYEAADIESGASVALKVLRPEFAGQPDAELRFRREAETARRLHHPNIVAVRDVGQAAGAAYVVMDLLPLTLSRRLELVHRLPEREVIRIGLDVASALAIAHHAGVVHRDIKPDNILLNEQGQAIVGDFGLARALQADPSVSQSQQVMGTPHYFSPEQARGLGVDGRSDLYSLGVTLFRAATGHVPYEGEDWYAVARQHIESPVPSAKAMVPELTDGFDAILQRLLAKNPDDRFANATMLIDALAQLPTAPERAERSMGSGSAETTLIAPAPFSAAFRRKRGKWVRGGAIAATLVSAAALLFLVQRPPASSQSNSTQDTLTGATIPPFLRDSALPPESLALSPGFFPGDRNIGTRSAPIDSARTRSTADSARRARVVITSDPAAAVYVNNSRAAQGSRIEVPVGSDVPIRAVLQNAAPDCQTAVRDSTVRLRAGQVTSITLAVRPCGTVVFTVTPPNANITLVSQLDASQIRLRADTTDAILLPVGRYTVTASATGYLNYDGFVVIENSNTPARLRIPLVAR